MKRRPNSVMRECSLPAAALFALTTFASSASAQGGPLVFVSNEGSHDISVINSATNTVVAHIPVAGRARGIQASPDRKHVYVAVSDDKPQATGSADAIAVIDIATR